MADPLSEKRESSIFNGYFWKIENEWKVGVDPANIQHEPFNPILEDNGTSIAWVDKAIKQHPMDKHYPHICFKCKHDLIWRELVTRNIYWEVKKYLITFKNDIKIVSIKDWLDNLEIYKHLKQLWRSSVVQFYCCDCYDDMMEEL